MQALRQLVISALEYFNGPRGEKLRYLFIGGCTTLVDYATYFVMTAVFGLGVTASNVVSVSVAIIFAYVTNKYIVFQSRSNSLRDILSESLKFLASRLFTMALEIGGVYLFVNIMGQHKQLGKIEAIIIVIIVNYFFSKFFVFTAKDGGKADG
jgi:putative flippase GtrA